LNGLQQLDVSDNKLAWLPKSFGSLINLETFYRWGNQLTSLPEWLGNLKLQNLSLSENQLTSLPESFGNLTRLQWLNLFGNKLTSLPTGIRELRALTHLFLHDNPALDLPVEVLGPGFNDVGGQTRPATPSVILDYYFHAHDG